MLPKVFSGIGHKSYFRMRTHRAAAAAADIHKSTFSRCGLPEFTVYIDTVVDTVYIVKVLESIYLYKWKVWCRSTAQILSVMNVCP